jgi:LmbE family N-acetylglucosaminyl deacetylase
VANAFNLAHLRKAPVPGEAFQAKAIFFYFLPPGMIPTFVVDITDEFDDWMAALDCHKSQFYNPEKPRPAHLPPVREVFATFASYWGRQIGVKYAHAYLSTSPLNVGDPIALVKDVTPRP